MIRDTLVGQLRRFVSIVLVVAQVWMGIPASALIKPSINPVRAAVIAHQAEFTATDLFLTRFRTKFALAAESIKSAFTSPSDFSRLASQFEEPLIATTPTSSKEDHALYEAMRSYSSRKAEDDFSALLAFLSNHPQSGWRVSLLTNLGLAYYHYGYFSNAIDSWEQAWDAGKSVTEIHGKALVDRAIGELMRMHARLGHADRLDALFKELADRHVSGPATEAVDGAKEGLWMMQHNPGIAYLCGPMALRNLLVFEKIPSDHVRFLEGYRSGQKGVSLAEVSELANRATLPHRLIFRAPDQPIPVPSIVHWKLSHFAAIVGESGKRFHVQDPTFGRDLWITRTALESQSSGYFLVPGATGPERWRKVSQSEASQVRGMGFTSTNDPNSTTPQDPTSQDNGDSGNCGMCGYAFSEMSVSLRLTDTPVGYRPPIGPDVHITLSYNQREASQPSNFSFFNISPKWTLNWLTYIQDDPNNPGSSVFRYVAGGGSVPYLGYNSSNGSFTPETQNAAVLTLRSSAPAVYYRHLADGSTEVYSKSNGATSYPRLIFLTKIIDSSGNSVALNYDSQLRLTSISDATGRLTTFAYGAAMSPLLVTRITDPFGRSAHITYDSSGRLSTITDILGLTSRFSYDNSFLVNTLTTPYGATQFSFGDNGNSRFLQATDPLGQTERLEFVQDLAQIPFSDPANLVPEGIQDPFNVYLNDRNTYYWDKHAYAVAAGDYTKARIRHWTHWALNTSVTGPTVESVKYPFENRIWNNYPGQIPDTTGLGTAVSGTLDLPSRIGRVLDDGTTQLTQLSYNSFGHVTDVIDPVGRETQFTYAPNQIDVLKIEQKTAASGDATVASFKYDSAHHPLTSTDASGQVTHTTYNGFGEPLEITDPLNQTTRYKYDSLGYLRSVSNANDRTAVSFTYDRFGRVATSTDSEGYTIAFLYDAADRIMQETFPDTSTRKFEWTNLDLTSVTDRQHNTTHYAYDAVRNLTSKTDPLDHVTKFGYWENQILKSLTDPNGNNTTWSIDVERRVTSKQFADGTEVINDYENTTNRLKSITDAMGQIKTFTYGLDDTLTNITYSNSVNQTPSVSFEYDPYFKRIVSVTDGTGTRNYVYQEPGSPGALKLVSESGPFRNDQITYSYDSLSRLSKRTVDSSPEAFAYDRISRVIRHDTDLGIFERTYLGQTRQMTGQRNRSGTVGTTWTYDTNFNDRRLKAIDNGWEAKSFRYTTTPENLITQIRERDSVHKAHPEGLPDQGEHSETWDYNYDDSYRLSRASFRGDRFAYESDPGGNITKFETPGMDMRASYNALNQITEFDRHTYLYDKNGNLLDDGKRTYTWDAENRLLSITVKANPSKITKFRYNGLGRRIAIETRGDGRFMEMHYLWCGDRLCQARTSADIVAKRYYAEGEYLASDHSGLYYAEDHLGSVRDLLNIRNGRREASFDYDPYGNSDDGSRRVKSDFQYAGMFHEANTGVYLAEYRAYAPETSRWLSRDPMAAASGANLYAYVQGDPIDGSDPFGLCTNWWFVAAAVGGLAALVAVIVLSDGLAAPEALPLAEEELAEIEAGSSSLWDATTLPQNGQALQVITDVTPSEIESTLVSNGYTAETTVGSNGPVTILQMQGGNTYTIYTATSTGETSMQVANSAGQVLVKYRWGVQ